MTNNDSDITGNFKSPPAKTRSPCKRLTPEQVRERRLLKLHKQLAERFVPLDAKIDLNSPVKQRRSLSNSLIGSSLRSHNTSTSLKRKAISPAQNKCKKLKRDEKNTRNSMKSEKENVSFVNDSKNDVEMKHTQRKRKKRNLMNIWSKYRKVKRESSTDKTQIKRRSVKQSKTAVVTKLLKRKIKNAKENIQKKGKSRACVNIKSAVTKNFRTSKKGQNKKTVCKKSQKRNFSKKVKNEKTKNERNKNQATQKTKLSNGGNIFDIGDNTGSVKPTKALDALSDLSVDTTLWLRPPDIDTSSSLTEPWVNPYDLSNLDSTGQPKVRRKPLELSSLEHLAADRGVHLGFYTSIFQHDSRDSHVGGIWNRISPNVGEDPT